MGDRAVRRRDDYALLHGNQWVDPLLPYPYSYAGRSYQLMTTFTSLIELTHELSVDDKLAWVGEHAIESAGETTTPNTVTKIESGSEWIRVDGEGIGGGEYYYKAYQDGSSEAFYVNPGSDSADYRGGGRHGQAD